MLDYNDLRALKYQNIFKFKARYIACQITTSAQDNTTTVFNCR